jgi:dolichol-phosphate mannosyltransferase
MNKVLVCPVAYNERVKLHSVISRYLDSPVQQQADYLIVDDASDDGTSDVIAGYAARGIGTIKHPQRRGVGAAIRTAIHYAREKGYEVLVIMAGNDKDNPEEISKLIEPILTAGYDFVQGSRYKKPFGSPVTQGSPDSAAVHGDMPLYRRIATKIHPWLMSVITGRKVTDSTNGFRAMRVSLFEDRRININQSWLDRYELEPYLLYKTITLGYRFMEAPVTKIYPSKKLGYTKMRPVVGWWSILRPLIYLGLGIKK